MRFFTYSTTDTTTGLNNSSVGATIRLGAEQFRIDFLSAWATSLVGMKLSLEDSNAGIKYIDNIVLGSIIGSDFRPFKLPVPIMLPVNCNVLVTLTDFSGSANKYNVNLIGYKMVG